MQQTNPTSSAERSTTRPIGRPRSEKSQDAVLKATRALLDEEGGSGLTIAAIARRSGVGKPTIYRWWPSVADIVLEVVLNRADADIGVPDVETFRGTLNEFLRQSMKALTDWGGIHLRFLMAQAQMDEPFRKRFRENFVAQRRAVLLSIFSRAMESGQIGSVHSPEMLTDIVFGAMWYRLLVGHGRMDEGFADELTEVVMGLV